MNAPTSMPERPYEFIERLEGLSPGVRKEASAFALALEEWLPGVGAPTIAPSEDYTSIGFTWERRGWHVTVSFEDDEPAWFFIQSLDLDFSPLPTPASFWRTVASGDYKDIFQIAAIVRHMFDN